MKIIDNINIKWREIVRRIYGLDSEVEDAMNDGLDSVSSTKSQLMDFHEMLSGLIKVIEGN